MSHTITLAVVVAALVRQGDRLSVPEPAFCKALSELGKRRGIDVYVCSADSFDAEPGRLTAWRWGEAGWSPGAAAPPDIVYDRSFFTSFAQRLAANRLLQRLRLLKRYRILGGGLPGKADVHEALRRHPELAGHLPPSSRFQAGEHSVAELLKPHAHGVVLKPSAGMQGKGVVHLARSLQGEGVIAKGRSGSNRVVQRQFASDSACDRWLERVTDGVSYIVQPYLMLRGDDDKPFDVRLLLQKDGDGRWTITGSVVRTGQPGTLTSNLHGGGSAEPALQALADKFGAPKAERLLSRLHTISMQTAVQLENEFGRLAELGLDLGIEPDGSIWLLEANSKPGRSSFRLIRDDAAWRLAVERPLSYAQWLVNRSLPFATVADSKHNRTATFISGSQKRPFNVQEVHR